MDYFIRRKACPGCGATRTQTIYERPFNDPALKSYLLNFYGRQGHIEFGYLENDMFILEDCLECGLVYQKAYLNDSLMEKLYEEWIDPHLVFEEEEKTFGLDYYSRYAQEIGTVLTYLNRIPTQLEFLDFGMGWGKWLKLVTGFGVSAYGTELSQSRIDYAKRFGVTVLSWAEVGPRKFDFINTEQVFEHIPNPLETLVHLKNALKPGALLKISVPDGSDIKRRLAVSDWKAEKFTRNSLNAVSPLEHINCFNFEAILKMADNAGLRRVVIPLRLQFAFLCHNSSLKNLMKNLVKPFYRNYGKSTYLFFALK